MTPIEQRAVAALANVSTGKHPWALHRVQEFYGYLVSSPSRVLTCEEAGDLWYLVWKYRVQITERDVVAHADQLVNGALALRF